MPSSSRHLLFFLFLLMAPACARQFPGTAPEAVSHVRSFYFNHDFEAGMHEGNSLIHRFPENLELRAWYLLNLTNSGIANNPAPRDSARTIAEHLTETSPQSPWGWFALAEVLNAPSLMVISAPEIGRFRIGVPTAEALAASRRALDLAPDHPDILWMRARTLRHHGQKDEFNTFVEQCKAANRTTVELLNVIADSAAFAEATTRDPNNAEAYYFRGRFFTWSRNLEKAYPLLKKACTLAPHSSEIHQLYWQTLLQKKDNKPEEIQKEIESDITTFLKNRTMHATSLVAVLEIYGEMGLVEKQRELADRILRDLSDSPAAEWPLTIRYRNYADSVFQANPNKIQTLAHDETYRDMLRNFIRRPHHNDPRLLAAAYTALFACLKEDPQEDPVVLLETVNNILRYDQARFSFQAPGYVIALTERTSSFQEIERIAQTGIQKIKSLLADARPPAWSDAEWDTWLDKQPPFTTMHDALGWLYFKQGRFQDAETYLLKSNEHQPRYVTNLYHLGKFYESRNHLQKAENFYLRGLKIQQPGENPCETALQNL
ncbi:MAG: tetratricopeptide repeat protein, partial [bacterium]|nr:tetratricopeptide repeat protein [bacterium]